MEKLRALFSRVLKTYPRSVAIARRPPAGGIRPVPHLKELDKFVGCWVAVKGDKVIAAAETSRGLAYELHKLGGGAKGAVMQYVRPSTDGYVVGVG